MTGLYLVVAVATNGVIGRDGDLPWRLPADLRRFRAITMGHPICMGRRTWDSIGRPLPGRRNLVVSSREEFEPAGAERVASLAAALEQVAGSERLMVIGGARLYAEALPLARGVYLTEVHAVLEGDVRFPLLAAGQWREVARERHDADADNEYDYSFVELERREGTE